MISLWRSAISRDACCIASSSAGSALEAVSCSNRPRVITNSPMRFISVSSRERSIRTWRVSRAPPPVGASAIASARAVIPIVARDACARCASSITTRAMSPADRTVDSISARLACVIRRIVNSIGTSAFLSSASGGCTVASSPSSRTFESTMNARTPGSIVDGDCVTVTRTPATGASSASAAAIVTTVPPVVMRIAWNSLVEPPPATS